MKVLFFLGCVGLAVIVAQIAGDRFYDAHAVWWAFAPAHFAAGMFVAIFGMYVAHGLHMARPLVPVLAFVFIVGSAWEVLEYALLIDILWYDTGIDIVLDMLGGFAGYKLIGTERV